MPVFRLDASLVFPSPELAERSGLLAVGGDLRPERLLLAYENGIFPWYSEGQPIYWHAPDPRFVLWPEQLHVPRSLAKILRRGDYEVRFDTAFGRVIRLCGQSPRPNQRGTWITRDMIRAYEHLHALGLAHSAEAWKDGELVGGLYGVCVGDVYFGESMFARAPDASKVAFVTLVRWLSARGVKLIDSQVYTEHLARFGAVEIPRAEYLRHLHALVGQPTRLGPWTLDPDDPARGHQPQEDNP